MVKLSVVILTKNEEKNILDCLENLNSVDEIIVIDDNSIDRTIEVVKSLKRKNIKVYQHALDSNFSGQRNFGLSQAKNEWVLFLDADERVSDRLIAEIESKIEMSSAAGFRIKRVDVMWRKKLRYGETGNIKLVRLAKKSAGKWKGQVHELWEVEGSVGELDNALMHYPHQTIREFLAEVNFYSTIRARELHRQGVSVSFWDIIFYPKAKFALNYFIKLGALDGLPGLIVAFVMSFHSFLVRAKLWQLNVIASRAKRSRA